MESLYHPEQRSFDLGGVFWRNKGKIVVTFALVIGLTLAFLSLVPRKFLSEAKVFVQLGHESMNLDPTATTGQVVGIGDTRESEINSVEQLLASRAVVEKVVDQYTPQVVLERNPDSGPLPGERLAWLDKYNLNPLRIYSLRDKAIEKFQENLGVTTGKKTNVISVSYESKDPVLSRDVLDSLLAYARDEHLRVNRTKGSQEFFEDQTKLLHGNLASLEDELRDLKNKTGLASLASQRDIQLEQIGSLQSDMLRAQAEQDAAAAEVVSRRKQLADSPAMIVTELTTGLPQTPRLTMRDKLYDLEVKEQDFASKLKDGAPQLIAIRTQIAEARKIAEQEAMTQQSTRGVNPSHQAAELALREREAKVASLTARTKSLGDKIAAAQSALKEINDNEVKLVSLEREIEIARATYRRYADNLEVARIDQELHNAKISSLNLLQPPSYSETPYSPNPLVVLGMGFVLACMSSLGIALLSEYRRRPAFAVAAASRDAAAVPVTLPVSVRTRLSEVAPANPR